MHSRSNNDGSDVTIDTNGLTITETAGVYTFTAADGDLNGTRDNTTYVQAYDNTTCLLTNTTVQAALDEVVTAIDDVIDAAATLNLVDNNFGSVTVSQYVCTILARATPNFSVFPYTTLFRSNNDGSDVTIDTNGLTITETAGVYTFTAAD